MTAYKSGPYVVQIEYFTPFSGVTLKHVMKLNCAATGTPLPGTPAASVLLQTAGGSSKSLATAVNEFWAFLRVGLSTTVTATLANFYAVTPGTDTMTFITSTPLTPSAGSAAGAVVAANEETLTFRSAKGSYMAIDVQETNATGNAQTPLVPFPSGLWYNVLAQYILSSGNWVACRDRSFPIAPMRNSVTQNEATYKKRYRNS